MADIYQFTRSKAKSPVLMEHNPTPATDSILVYVKPRKNTSQQDFECTLQEDIIHPLLSLLTGQNILVDAFVGCVVRPEGYDPVAHAKQDNIEYLTTDWNINEEEFIGNVWSLTGHFFINLAYPTTFIVNTATIIHKNSKEIEITL